MVEGAYQLPRNAVPRVVHGGQSVWVKLDYVVMESREDVDSEEIDINRAANR